MASAQAKLDEFNLLANAGEGNQLTNILVNLSDDTWAVNGSDCIDQGGLGKDQIATEVNAFSPTFTVNTYEELFNLGYVAV